MKTLTAIIITFAALSTSSHARLGETLDQCIARYGEVHDTDDKLEIYVFNKDGINIGIRFNAAGKADLINFASDNTRGSKLTVPEYKTLMQINLGEDLRERSIPGSTTIKYVNRETGNFGMIFGSLLIIASESGYTRFQEAMAASAKSGLSGF